MGLCQETSLNPRSSARMITMLGGGVLEFEEEKTKNKESKEI